MPIHPKPNAAPDPTLEVMRNKLRMPADIVDNAITPLMSPENREAADIVYRRMGAPTDSALHAVAWSHAAAQGAAEKGMPTATDEVTLEGTEAFARRHPSATYGVIDKVRRTWRNLREDVAQAAVSGAVGGASPGGRSLIKDIALAVLGSDAAQIALGGVEPLMRGQQATYGLLMGEGWAAFSRLWPTVVVEDEYNEDGTPREISPFSAAIDAAWSTVTGQEDAQEDRDLLRQVNEQYMDQNLMSARDVLGKWTNDPRMDNWYDNMSKQGWIGEVCKAHMSVNLFVADLFVDPLLVFDKAGVWLTKGMRAAQKSGVKAAQAARVAAKTNRMNDILDALKQSAKHVEMAMEKHNANPTHESLARLRNAEKLHAQNVDTYAAKKMSDGVDTVNMSAVPHADPRTIPTWETSRITDTITAPEGLHKTPWERTLDRMRGHGLQVDTSQAREEFMKKHTGADSWLSAEEAIARINTFAPGTGPDYARLNVMQDIADKAGVRLRFFDNPLGRHPIALYDNVSATIYLNIAEKQGDTWSTFVHEMMHHAFDTNLSTQQQFRLMKALKDGGVDLKQWAAPIQHQYGFTDDLGRAGEFIPVATSEALVMQNPNFWRILREASPEAFDSLGKTFNDLAVESAGDILMIGGRSPSKWFKNQDEFVKSMRTARAALKAALGRDKAAVRHMFQDYEETITKHLDELQHTRDQLTSVNASTKHIDRTISRLTKFRDRLVADPFNNIEDFGRYQAEAFRVKDADELHKQLALERKASAMRHTNMVQPREDPSTWMQGDLFADASDDVIDRVALGPDTGEHLAEGLGRVAWGSEIDDIAVPLSIVPERQAMSGGRIVPLTKDNLIDLDAIADATTAAKKAAAERQLSLGDFDPYSEKMAKAVAEARAAGKPVPYDMGWLPKARPSTAELVQSGWLDEYGANMFDRLGSALYPHNWKAWNLKAISALRMPLMNLREPMRVLEEVDPGKSWPILRGAMHNAESETTRLKSVFHGAMEKFGALTIEKPSTLRRILFTGAEHSEKVNQELNELLFKCLDVVPGSKEWDELVVDLTSDQLDAISAIRNELNHNADRLGITNTQKFVDGYVHHAFDPNWFAKGGTPNEFLGMGRSGKIFMKMLMDRTGATGYKLDAVGALDLYARGFSRKIHIEPALERLLRRGEAIAAADPTKQWYLPYLHNTVSQVRGEPSRLGHLIDEHVGQIAKSLGVPYAPGALTRKLMGISSLIYASLLTGNRRYPIMSLATSVATTAARFGTWRTVKALMNMATPEGQLVWKSVGGERLWGRIFEGDLASHYAKMLSSIRPGMPSIQDVENGIRGMTFHAAVDELMTKSGFQTLRAADDAGMLNEILFDALRSTEEVNHFFGTVSKPPIFSRTSKSGAVLATQFTSFPFKQTEQLLAMEKDLPGRIWSYMSMSGWISRVAAQEVGVDLRQYVGGEYVPRTLSDVVSPAVSTLAASVRMMEAMNAVQEGYGTVDEANESINEFLKQSETMIPFLGMMRSWTQSIEGAETGQVGIPGVGRARPVDVPLGPLGMPMPGGPKGERNEAMAFYTGARSIDAELASGAKREIQQAKNRAAVERLELIEEANKAMEDGDWTSVQAQLKRMATMNFPIGDISTPVKMRQEMQRLNWYILELKRNPQLAHKLVPIMERYGMLGTAGGQQNEPQSP